MKVVDDVVTVVEIHRDSRSAFCSRCFSGDCSDFCRNKFALTPGQRVKDYAAIKAKFEELLNEK